jgi:hypothetical protein
MDKNLSVDRVDLQAADTVENILKISPERMMEITETIQEVCDTHLAKAEAIVALSQMKATDAEKVFMGFLLCRYFISNSFPRFIADPILKKIG